MITDRRANATGNITGPQSTPPPRAVGVNEGACDDADTKEKEVKLKRNGSLHYLQSECGAGHRVDRTTTTGMYGLSSHHRRLLYHRRTELTATASRLLRA